jgi:hypothetical protein
VRLGKFSFVSRFILSPIICAYMSAVDDFHHTGRVVQGADFNGLIDGDDILPLERSLMFCLSRHSVPLMRNEKVSKISRSLCVLSPVNRKVEDSIMIWRASNFYR